MTRFGKYWPRGIRLRPEQHRENNNEPGNGGKGERVDAWVAFNQLPAIGFLVPSTSNRASISVRAQYQALIERRPARTPESKSEGQPCGFPAVHEGRQHIVRLGW